MAKLGDYVQSWALRGRARNTPFVTEEELEAALAEVSGYPSLIEEESRLISSKTFGVIGEAGQLVQLFAYSPDYGFLAASTDGDAQFDFRVYNGTLGHNDSFAAGFWGGADPSLSEINIGSWIENFPRLTIKGDGSMYWGEDGSAAPIWALKLAANGSLGFADIDEDGFNFSADGTDAGAYVNIYGPGGQVGLSDGAGHVFYLDPASGVQATEIADPPAAPANSGRFYFRDNGSGKTQAVVRFATGGVQVLATEP